MSEQPSDAEILFPDEVLTIAGEQVTVREYRYLEGLRATALARPLLDRMREMIASGVRSQEMLEQLILEHQGIWLQLMALATDRDSEWVAGLREQDGTALTMAYWRVNGGFFMRRLLLSDGVTLSLDALMGLLSPSPSSSTPSSPAATAETPLTSPAD